MAAASPDATAALLAALLHTGKAAGGSPDMSMTGLITQALDLAVMNNVEGSLQMYNAWNGSRLAYSLYQKLSGQAMAEQAKERFYDAIVQYVRDNPRSTEAEKAAEIKRQVIILAATLNAIYSGHVPLLGETQKGKAGIAAPATSVVVSGTKRS